MKTEEQVMIIKGRKYVPIGLIQSDLNQPRKAFSEEKLKEMAESIKANGIIQDLIVEPLDKPAGHYLLIDGERRWRAAKLAGLPVVPITERTDVNEKSRAVVQAVANQQHENLSALKAAAAYQRQIERGWHTAETLYKALGISRATLFARLALNRLTPAVREAVVVGKISVSVAGLIGMIPGEKNQTEALEECEGEGTKWSPALSFRDAQELIERDYCKPLKGAPFDLEKAYQGEISLEDGQNPPAGESGWQMAKGKWRLPLEKRTSCEKCPFRSANMEGIEAKNPNVCTQPRCYGAKCAAERKAEQKVLAAVALKALPAIREKLKKLPAVEAWRAVVKRACNDWEFLKSKGVAGVSSLERKAKTMKEEELREMALECAFRLHDPVKSYSAAFEGEFQQAAVLAGVDLKEMVAKEKASAKGAKKETAKNAGNAKGAKK